jgi:hypothetical protein
MSFIQVLPEMVEAATHDLANIRSTLTETTAAAAGPTTSLAAAARDEVSEAVATLFGNVGQEFQALSAQAQAFHQQFENLLSAGANMYTDAEAAAEQMLQSATGTPIASVTSGITNAANAIAAPYENLVAETGASLQGIGSLLTTQTGPALLQAINTQVAGATQVTNALGAAVSGNARPLLTLSGQAAQGYANLVQAITAQPELVVTGMTSSNLSLALQGPVYPGLLAYDLIGPPVNSLGALAASGSAFVNAVQTGNPLAAVTALVDAPANMTNAFLNGSEMLNFQSASLLPLGMGTIQTGPGSFPLFGLLAPLQPFSATGTLVGNPLQTFDITGPPVGGFIPALLDLPQLLGEAL